MTSSLFEKIPSSGKVVLSRDVYDYFKTGSIELEYYFFGGGTHHGGVCFRSLSDKEKCGVIELLFSVDKVPELEWFTNVRTGVWDPKKRHVFTSKIWTKEKLLIFSKEFERFFKKYHILFNNCNSWKIRFVKFLRCKPDLQVDPTNTIDEFMALAERINCQLVIEMGRVCESASDSEDGISVPEIVEIVDESDE